MKKYLSFLLILLCLGVGRAETITWTSGIAFPTGNVNGNWTNGWFTVVAPASGTISDFTLALGTQSGVRKDAYLAISADAKTTTTGFTAGDFVAISSNTCGISETSVTMSFATPVQLVACKTYYVYCVTESAGTYTTVQQRFQVESSTNMCWGAAGATTVKSSAYAVPFTADLSLTETNVNYRIKSKLAPTNYVCSSTTDENKLYKIAPSSNLAKLTDTRYVWNATYNEGIILRNVGNDHYIPRFTTNTSNGNSVNYLSATSTEDAEKFTPETREDAGALYIRMKSKTYGSDTWLDAYSSNNNTVGCHNAAGHAGNAFLFQALKTVTFTPAVAVDGGDAVTTIYVAQDGTDSFTLPADKLYTINGVQMGNVDAVDAIAAAGTENITVAVADNATQKVTYILSWDGEDIMTESNVSVFPGTLASASLPAAFVSDLTTLSYSPETITDETTLVTVTATWNGLFQLSGSYAAANWYTVGIHKYYEGNNYIWTYNNGDNTVKPEAVATNDYAGIDDTRLFCFVGNPYEGFTIYNKAAGDTYKMYRPGDNVQMVMDTENSSNFVPKSSDAGTIANGYFCLQPSGSAYYVNYDITGPKLGGWTAADQGSTCWVTAPSQYPLNFIGALGLDAPANSVGTKIVDESVITAAVNLNASLASNPFYYAEESNRTSANTTLDALNTAGTVALSEGYYRIVNAYSGFATSPAMYYASSVGKIKWSTLALTNADYRVNSIFKVSATATDGEYNIYVPNAAKSVYGTSADKNVNLGELDAENATAITFASLGKAQYNILRSGNEYPMHTKGWNGYSDGEIVAWGGNANSPSAWYIVPANDITIDLHAVGTEYYATLCLPFDVTLSGANAYTLTLNDAQTALTLSEAITEIPAGTPVLLMGDNATATATIASTAPCAAAPLTSTSLTGTYTNLTVTADTDYFLGTNEGTVGFYKWDGTTLKANRAYLPASAVSGSSVRGFAIQGDMADAIQAIEGGQLSLDNAGIYNLAGQRMSKLQRGVNIVGGKKLIVK